MQCYDVCMCDCAFCVVIFGVFIHQQAYICRHVESDKASIEECMF